GDTIDMVIGGQAMELPIVAVLPTTTYGGPDLLLPQDIVPASVLEQTSAQTLVSTAEGMDTHAVGEVIGGTVPGSTVTDLDTWVDEHSAAQQNAQLQIFTVLLGMSSLYALFAAINAVVIATSDRRGEFAAARLSGLTRWQVVRMAVTECTRVTGVGTVLGGVCASGTRVWMRSDQVSITGLAVIGLPWLIILSLVTGAFTVIGLTSWFSSRSASRPAPVPLVTEN